MADEPTAPCPVCAKPTVGLHIAGTVYDFVCDPCAEQTDADIRALVSSVVDEIVGEGSP